MSTQEQKNTNNFKNSIVIQDDSSKISENPDTFSPEHMMYKSDNQDKGRAGLIDFFKVDPNEA